MGPMIYGIYGIYGIYMVYIYGIYGTMNRILMRISPGIETLLITFTVCEVAWSSQAWDLFQWVSLLFTVCKPASRLVRKNSLILLPRICLLSLSIFACWWFNSRFSGIVCGLEIDPRGTAKKLLLIHADIWISAWFDLIFVVYFHHFPVLALSSPFSVDFVGMSQQHFVG